MVRYCPIFSSNNPKNNTISDSSYLDVRAPARLCVCVYYVCIKPTALFIKRSKRNPLMARMLQANVRFLAKLPSVSSIISVRDQTLSSINIFLLQQYKQYLNLKPNRNIKITITNFRKNCSKIVINLFIK